MANINKLSNSKTKQSNRHQRDKHKTGARSSGSGHFKKQAHVKAVFVNSRDIQKEERAKKFQERQALRVQKQKELEEERAKVKKEKDEKIRQYKKKRLEKTKAISKRTQRGQPLMKDRMQLLLKQIQEMKKNG